MPVNAPDEEHALHLVPFVHVNVAELQKLFYTCYMVFDWDSGKDHLLITERNVSFSQVIVQIELGRFHLMNPHPNREKYPDQVLFFVVIEDYVYVVPAVKRTDSSYFLKTIYPSRKWTREFQEGRLNV